MDDEPKPKRRSGHSHVFSGFTLLVCIGVGMWLVDQAGWTNWGEWWQRTRLYVGGSEAMREQVKKGDVQNGVHHRFGRGHDVSRTDFSLVEEYPQYRSRVVYKLGWAFYGNDWFVDRVEDLSGVRSSP